MSDRSVYSETCSLNEVDVEEEEEENGEVKKSWILSSFTVKEKIVAHHMNVHTVLNRV
jgi:hypothetical protein